MTKQDLPDDRSLQELKFDMMITNRVEELALETIRQIGSHSLRQVRTNLEDGMLNLIYLALRAHSFIEEDLPEINA